VWQPDGTLVMTIEANSGIWTALFSPDAKYILTAGTERSAHLWRSDGTQVSTLEGHTAELTTARFSPDGRLILTASYDGSLRLWGLPEKESDGVELIAILEGHRNWVYTASFSPDSRWIISAIWDGTARLWSVYPDVDEMLAEGKRRVGRDLTQEECQRYLYQDLCPLHP